MTEVAYYCNKCGYYGSEMAHSGCNYHAGETLTSQLTREIASMRRVVEAAERWRDHTGGDWQYPWEAPLRQAVDEYRNARSSDPRGVTGEG